VHTIRCLSLLPLLVAGCAGETTDDPDGANASSAWAVAVRIVDPDGRTVFVSAVEDISTGNFDLGSALEFSGFSRVFAHDGHILVMDGESGQIVKFEVDDTLALREVGRLSFQNEGVVSFRSTFAFPAPDRSLYIDLDNSQVIVWDPAEMVIVDAVPSDVILRDGFDVTGDTPLVTSDRVVMGLSWANFLAADLVPSVAALVLDRETGETLGLAEDESCVNTGGTVADADGNVIVLGDNAGGLYEVFQPGVLPPPCLLTLPSGATGFDPASYVDPAKLTGSAQVSGLIGGPAGLAMTKVLVDGEVPPDADAFGWPDAGVWNWARIDLENETVEVAEGPGFAESFGPFADDDGFYLVEWNADDGTSQLSIWTNDAAAPSPGLATTGEFQYVGRVR